MSDHPAPARLLTRSDVRRLLPLADCIDAVETAFRRSAAAQDAPPRILGLPVPEGGFHVKAAAMGRHFAAKLNAKPLAAVLATRSLTRVFAYDRDHATAVRFARERAEALGISVEPTRDLAAAARRSDIVVTCTPARAPLIGPADIRPGTFIAAVGADSEDKQELDPALLVGATVVVDSLEQCATIGELHQALAAGLLTRDAVHAELGQIIAGLRTGRTSADEITVFDSTGTALQDVAAAMVYERACAAPAGATVDLSA